MFTTYPFRWILGILAIACFGIVWYTMDTESVDVVNGVPPMSTALQNVAAVEDVLATLPEDERGAYLEEHYPRLEIGVVHYLRRMGKLSPDVGVDRVEFRFGSLDNIEAESEGGTRVHGYFEDRLIAVVHPTVGEPIATIVKCMNGTFMLPDQLLALQEVGSHTPLETFVIGRGEGLLHHVPWPVAIDLAEQHNLPLYRGKRMRSGNRITPDEARALEFDTDRVQVTVYVERGDFFDLRHGTYEPVRARG